MAVKKKLAVCGCSFMWSSRTWYDNVKGTSWDQKFPINESEYIKKEKQKIGYQHWPSFTDIFADRYDYDVYNFAKGGVSNFEIREQISLAVLLKPDLIVIGSTDANRIEVKNKSDEIVSSSFLISNNDSFTPETKSAFKSYMTFLHDHKVSEKKSYYIIQNGLYYLEKHNLQYIFLPGPMKNLNWSMNKTVWPNDFLQPWDIAGTKNYSQHGNHCFLDKQLIFFDNLEKILGRKN